MDRLPILRIGDLLLVSIQVDLQDTLALQLLDDLSERIVSDGAHGVLIDISALDIVDSFVGRTLSTIAAVARVLDADTVVVGMRPAVAITLVELGLSLDGVRTALTVDKGIALLARTEPGAHDDADEPGSEGGEDAGAVAGVVAAGSPSLGLASGLAPEGTRAR